MPRQPAHEALAVHQLQSNIGDEEDEPGAGHVDETIMQDQQHEGEADGYASSTPTSSLTWIAWFCSLPGHEYFCEVSEDFIEDDFNLTGLASLVPFWKEAMEMVLDVEPEDSLKIPDVTIVESSAELLYGLVHQRYILTRPGLQAMVEKYEAGHFGTCPRVYCHSTHVAPCGRTDLPGLDTVKLYCPNCNDTYTPPSSRFQGVDGAFFGTTFVHLLFQTFRELAPAPYCPPAQPINSSARSPGGTYSAPAQFFNPNPHGGQKAPAGRIYIPKIYGFRVSERARSGPRMHWLRLRPETAEELDHVDSKGRWIDSFEFDDESDHEDRGRHASSLFEGADDEEDDDEEEEEEEEPQASPPGPTGPGRSGRQKPLSSLRDAGENVSDADSDGETVILAAPRRSPPRHSKSYRSRRTSLPHRMLDSPNHSSATRPAAETDTDSGLVSSSSCSSSAIDTPGEDAPIRPLRSTPRKVALELTTSMKSMMIGANVEDDCLVSQSFITAL
ncbi:casein kinase 2 regulatory subunit [Tulasnella sp. JGI-2019a]|nr:casein kinase 2 regulatory subunit [Tulasnella sp. JGI-2019a]